MFLWIQVYQEKAVKDKERYRVEMEDYRERLKMGQIISDAVPIQQRLPHADVDMVEAEAKTEMEGGESPQTPENESSSGKTDSDDDDKTAEKEFDMETYPGVGVGVEGGECSNVVVVGMETSVEEETYESGKRVEKVGVESEESLENAMEKEK